MASVSREEFNIKEATQDEKLDHLIGKVSYIEGKIDGKQQTGADTWARLGIIGLFIGLVWDAFKDKVGG